jgi:hypothetical protein
LAGADKHLCSDFVSKNLNFYKVKYFEEKSNFANLFDLNIKEYNNLVIEHKNLKE